MRVEQRKWDRTVGWGGPFEMNGAQLVLCFASRSVFESAQPLGALRDAYPSAILLGCSTAGEIRDVFVEDETAVVTALQFEETRVRCSARTVQSPADSEQVGREIARELLAPDLSHVFVLSDGLHVNGSQLVAGITAELPRTVTVTGGLSGDGTKFEKTLVLVEGQPTGNALAAVGFYGSSLRVGCASLGGWDSFGPERLVTRSAGNVLHELDGQCALSLYKTYLGEHAGGLPSTGLLFPLQVRGPEGGEPVVRTILAVDEKDRTMTFAGDVPEGHYARLMRANFDRLVDGAGGAAKRSQDAVGQVSPDVAILISCVGRRLVLQQRVEEEVEAVRDVLGKNATLTGFYSYGEISPFTPEARCELHNQTMTITTLREDVGRRAA